MKKLMLTAAAFALAVPVMTLSAMAQPDHRRDSTFQQRAEGRLPGQHGQRGQDHNRPQPQQAAPTPPALQPAQQNAQNDRRGPDRSGDRDRDRGPDNRSGNRGDHWSGNRGPDNHARPGDDRRPDYRRDTDRRPDYRRGNDRRPDYRPGNNRPGGFDNHRDRRDWSSWRSDNRSWHRPNHRFRGPSYHRPSGWYYRRWSFGDFLPSLFWSSQYWISNYAMYDLPPPPPGAVWVRYGDDAVLIDRFTGEVIDVEYDFFY
jgi:Ni/Co efflux regulator RcnB